MVLEETMARVRVLALATLTALGAGCSAADGDRPLSFSPHVYRGTRLPPLTVAQLGELQERGRLQR
jgi:hypothetical protein